MTTGPRSFLSLSRLALASGVVVLSAALVASTGLPAVAAEPAATTPAAAASPTPAEPAEPAVMGEYSAKSYASAAKKLPAELIDALERDVDVTGAEYLANAAAATDATAVLAALGEAGVGVVGSHLDGTELVVNVDSAADAAAVEAAGAVADFSEPVVPDLSGITPRFLTANASDPNLSGGEAFAERRYGFRCSIGFSGIHTKSWAKQLVTAGHCSEKKTTAYYFLPQTKASTGVAAFGSPWRRLGTPVSGSFGFGNGNDAGLIAVAKGYYVATPTVSVWNGATGEADSTIDVLDRTPAVTRALICKSGATTGWSCGHVVSVDTRVKVEGEYVNSIVTDVCTMGGDSGGAVVIGNSAVGTVSWGTASGSCQSDDYAGFFPLVSASTTSGRNQSVAKKLPHWEPLVALSVPTILAPADASTLDYAASISGEVADGNIRHRVVVYVDGKATTLVAKVTSAGTWKTRLVGVKPGTHTVAVRTRWGKMSSSAIGDPITVTVSALPAIAALSTAKPYDTSASDSAAAFPGGATTAYIAQSGSTTDIYAASAAAAKANAPVLLTARGTIPAAVVTELKRLGVTKITVAGGSTAITSRALATLKKITKVVVHPDYVLTTYAKG